MVAFTVDGKPIPQGSKTVFMVKGRPVLADANSKALAPWRKQVKAAAESAWGGRVALVGPVAVRVVFRFERGKTVRREHMTTKPDGDKLLRAVCDALTAAGVWADDSHVVHFDVTKRYAGGAESAGAFVEVGVIEEEK